MDGAGSNELFHGVSAPTSGDARERESEREEKEKKKKKKMDGAGSNELFYGVSAPTSGMEVPTATDINIPPEENVISGRQNVASGSGSGSGSASSNSSVAREQDLCMPIANIIRIMRTVLPADAKISDDAKQAMQDCVSEFISFITSEANERCHRELRKTVTAEDLLWAMSSLGFDNYIEPLTMYLRGYRALNGSPRGSFRGLPLPPPRRTTPAVDAAASASTASAATSAAAPLPQFHMPAAAPPMPPFSVYGAGYNVNMHGRRDEFGGSSSSEAPPMNQSFYPRPPFN